MGRYSTCTHKRQKALRVLWGSSGWSMFPFPFPSMKLWHILKHLVQWDIWAPSFENREEGPPFSSEAARRAGGNASPAQDAPGAEDSPGNHRGRLHLKQEYIPATCSGLLVLVWDEADWKWKGDSSHQQLKTHYIAERNGKCAVPERVKVNHRDSLGNNTLCSPTSPKYLGITESQCLSQYLWIVSGSYNSWVCDFIWKSMGSSS